MDFKAIMLLILVLLCLGIAGEMELNDKLAPLKDGSYQVVTDKDGEPQMVAVQR